MKLQELKAQAYDIIAAMEQKQREIQQLQQALNAKNEEISAALQAEQEPQKKEAKA